MAEINRTSVYYRQHWVPYPQPGESSFFNQHHVRVTISMAEPNLHAVVNPASIHLTDRRLMVILQHHQQQNSDGGADIRTFQVNLQQLSSVNCRCTFRSGIRLSLRQEGAGSRDPIQLGLTFSKKDGHRSRAFQEYLTMIMAGLSLKQKSTPHEQLPSYQQSLRDRSIPSAVSPPPPYSA